MLDGGLIKFFHVLLGHNLQFGLELGKVGARIEEAEVLKEPGFSLCPVAFPESTEKLLTLRNSNEEMEVVAHHGVGEDFNPRETFEPSHDAAKGLFLDLSEQQFASGDS